MKKFKKILSGLFSMIFVIGIIFSIQTVDIYAIGNTYYVDSVTGNDSNSGTSESTAWKTLDKVNRTTFLAGDSILFMKGSSWTGSLSPKGSGDASEQIIIDNYGTGALPIIDGAGARSTIHLTNQEYWTIQNLEVKNTDPTPSTVEQLDGVRITVNEPNLVADNIFIKNLTINNVQGSHIRAVTSFYDNAAIYFDMAETVNATSKFNNILIENNTISDVKTGGISFTFHGDAYRHTSSTWSTNVVIRNNTILNTGADGMIVAGADGPLVEYNISGNAGINGDSSTEYIAGIWSHNTNNAIFQYNECYGTQRYTGDGAAWDTDWADSGTHIYQYNYSHDNEGGSKIGPFNGSAPWNSPNLVKDIFRYNISQNDGTNEVWIGIGSVVDIYNNVFYCGTGNFQVWSRDGVYGSLFRNNIVVAGSASYSSSGNYSNNLYSGHTAPTDANKVVGDPQFISGGSGGLGITSVDGYKLNSTSPALNAGTVIADNGGKDYWGNSLYYGAPDIGAYESQSDATLPVIENVKSDTNNLAQTGSGRSGIYNVAHQSNPLITMTDGIKTGNLDSWSYGDLKTQDYWGIGFDKTYGFNKLAYTTGSMFIDGGWFESGLKVQVRQSGQWIDVSNTSVSPAYPYNNTAGDNNTYTFTFDDTWGDAIRIIGKPIHVSGYDFSFTSIAEFEVYYMSSVVLGNEKSDTNNIAQTGSSRTALFKAAQQGNPLDIMTNGIKTGSLDSWSYADLKSEDYWGIGFDRTYGFSKLVYTTGNVFVDGGWFERDLKVQVRQEGQWIDVSNTSISPVYPYNNTAGNNSTYTFVFDDTWGDAIRIIGTPVHITGYNFSFTSIAELEIYYTN